MAELLKSKQVRNGHRTHAKKLMDKSLTETPIPSLQETLEKSDVEIL